MPKYTPMDFWTCENKHKLKFSGTEVKQGFGSDLIIYWVFDCVHCRTYMLVNRDKWLPKFIGKKVNTYLVSNSPTPPAEGC